MNFNDEHLSSSSSSDEAEDNLAFVNIFNAGDRRNNRVIPRIENYVENVVVRYNIEEFRKTFRLRPASYEFLLHLLGPDLQGTIYEFGNVTISPGKQLYIFLYYFGTPLSYRSIADRFGVGEATAWRSVFRCVVAIYAYRNYFIRWPTPAEAQNTSQTIERKNRFPKVIGAVDGTHIRIQAPKIDSEAYFNRKKFASIHLQVVCNQKLEFIHCFAGFPGSVHDMRVFKHSGLQDLCNENNFINDSHLLADSAYTLQQHVLVPFRDNGHLTVEERHFNRILSSNRVMVECSIGLLKLRWRRLLDMCSMKRIDLLPFYIITCCILHNICLKPDNEFEYPLIAAEEINGNRGPLAPDNRAKRIGNEKRNLIKDILNNDLQQ